MARKREKDEMTITAKDTAKGRQGYSTCNWFMMADVFDKFGSKYL